MRVMFIEMEIHILLLQKPVMVKLYLYFLHSQVQKKYSEFHNKNALLVKALQIDSVQCRRTNICLLRGKSMNSVKMNANNSLT